MEAKIQEALEQPDSRDFTIRKIKTLKIAPYVIDKLKINISKYPYHAAVILVIFLAIGGSFLLRDNPDPKKEKQKISSVNKTKDDRSSSVDKVRDNRPDKIIRDEQFASIKERISYFEPQYNIFINRLTPNQDMTLATKAKYIYYEAKSINKDIDIFIDNYKEYKNGYMKQCKEKLNDPINILKEGFSNYHHITNNSEVIKKGIGLEYKWGYKELNLDKDELEQWKEVILNKKHLLGFFENLKDKKSYLDNIKSNILPSKNTISLEVLSEFTSLGSDEEIIQAIGILIQELKQVIQGIQNNYDLMKLKGHPYFQALLPLLPSVQHLTGLSLFTPRVDDYVVLPTPGSQASFRSEYKVAYINPDFINFLKEYYEDMVIAFRTKDGRMVRYDQDEGKIYVPNNDFCNQGVDLLTSWSLPLILDINSISSFNFTESNKNAQRECGINVDGDIDGPIGSIRKIKGYNSVVFYPNKRYIQEQMRKNNANKFSFDYQDFSTLIQRYPLGEFVVPKDAFCKDDSLVLSLSKSNLLGSASVKKEIPIPPEQLKQLRKEVECE